MMEPHGGELVDRVVDGSRADRIRESLSSAPAVRLRPGQVQDLLNISVGRYSPLEGFMQSADFQSVLDDGTLADGTPWPIPIVLDISPDLAEEVSAGDWLALRGPDGARLGGLEVGDRYRYDDERTATRLFGTTDQSHPGVASLYDRHDVLVGGSVAVLDEQRQNRLDQTPAETRAAFERNGWDTVVGFQTRNAPHRAHEYIQKCALEQADGLFIQPKLGEKKTGDYHDEAIVGAYERLLERYYPDDSAVLSVFPSRMNYAGPREAIFDALVRKNHGCTHFIVGRDHAGVDDYYDEFGAHGAVEDAEIGIEPILFDYAFHCGNCDGMVSEKVCPHEDEVRTYPSGTKIRQRLRNGESPSEKVMRSEVAAYLMEQSDPFVSSESEVSART